MSGDKITVMGPAHIRAEGGLALTFVMLGLTFFSASMWTEVLSVPVSVFNDFFSPVLIGNLLLVYTAFLGFIGSKTGLTNPSSRALPFGIKGSAPSFLLGGTQVGWFGVGVVPCLPFRSAKQRAGISTG